MKWKNIEAKFDEILKQQEEKYIPGGLTKGIVWIGKSDTAGSWETDEEWIGVDKDGQLHWAYASGCSCWDGDFSNEIIKDIKIMELMHKHTPEEWLGAIEKYDKTLNFQEL